MKKTFFFLFLIPVIYYPLSAHAQIQRGLLGKLFISSISSKSTKRGCFALSSQQKKCPVGYYMSTSGDVVKVRSCCRSRLVVGQNFCGKDVCCPPGADLIAPPIAGSNDPNLQGSCRLLGKTGPPRSEFCLLGGPKNWDELPKECPIGTEPTYSGDRLYCFNPVNGGIENPKIKPECPANIPASQCGNGKVERGEECDDKNVNACYGNVSRRPITSEELSLRPIYTCSNQCRCLKNQEDGGGQIVPGTELPPRDILTGGASSNGESDCKCSKGQEWKNGSCQIRSAEISCAAEEDLERPTVSCCDNERYKNNEEAALCGGEIKGGDYGGVKKCRSIK